MTKDELQALGITPEDVLNRLTEKLCDRYVDDESDYANKFQNRLQGAVTKRVDEVLEKSLAKHVLPKIKEMVESICLEETNRWGEKRGTKLTFIEYLVQRTDAYIREEVDYQGKPKGTDSYQWRAHSTRIAHMIHELSLIHISEPTRLLSIS